MAAIQTVAQEPTFQNIKYSITVDMFQAGKLKYLPGLMDGSRFNAAIIANTIPQDDQFMTDHPIQTPIVFIGRNIPNYSSVREMADITGKKAADILVAAECRNLAILRANLMTQITQARLNGFLENALQLTGALPAEITANGFSEKDGYLAMRQFFTTDRKIDGLYVITDSLAVGAYHAIKEKGLKIPQDIAVIGTGDNTVAPFLDPPLSTFNRSLINLHEEAVRLLFRQISGQITQPTQIVVPVVPVLRDSTRRGRNKNLSF
jgi:LacI family transcriptional regulator